MSKKQDGQNISSESGNKYFTMIENIALLELKPHQLALYANYKRTCGDGGTTFKSLATLAKETHMGKSKITSTRKELEELGYIKVTQKPDEGGNINQPPDVVVCDLMPRNVSHFQTLPQNNSPLPQNNSPLPRDDTKEEPFKKNSLIREKETTLSDKSDGANSTTEKQGYTKDHLQYAITFEWNALKKTGCTPKLDEWKSMFNDSEQLLVLKKAVALSKESLPEIQPQSERDSKAEAMVDTSFEDTQAEQSALDKPNVENDAMKAKRDRAELDVLNEKLVQVAKAKHGLFDEIALALGHDETSLKSKAVGRVVGQTRKAFLDEGFVLGEAKQYIERLRAYYRKQEWTITDEIYKTDKNLARWAKAKANNSEIADVNGVNPANKVQVKSNIQGTGTLETGLVVESEKPPKIDDPEMDRLFDELEAKLS